MPYTVTLPCVPHASRWQKPQGTQVDRTTLAHTKPKQNSLEILQRSAGCVA